MLKSASAIIKDFTELKGHYKATLRLGIPLAIGQTGVIVVSFADTAMVGHYSTDALAAASFVNNLFNIVTFVLMGYTYGLTPLVSALYGRGCERRAGRVLRNALGAGALFCGGVMAVMGALYFLLGHMGQPAEIMPLVRPYYLTVLVSMAFVMLYNQLRQFTDGTTDTAAGMWALLIGNALNILGNWLLIGGVGPFPELGLMGAGLSTLAARVTMAVLLAVIILRKRRYARCRQGFAASHMRRAEVAEIHRGSYPVATQMGLETGSFTASGVMAGWIGAVSLAAYQVLLTVGTLGFLFYYSFGAGMSIRVATFAGSADWRRVRLAGRAGCHLLCLLATCSSLVFILLAGPLTRIFTTDALVLAAAVATIGPLVLYQFGDAMQICFANALRGTGEVRPMMRVAAFSYLVVGIPCGYVLAFPCGLGLQGLFLAFSAGLFTAAWLFYRHFRRVLAAHGTA